MKLVKLTVERFQCIDHAEVEFGPGLNVLFGPNDLGKSSLAWAIRAVLLMQHGAKEHQRFVSWYGGGAPKVTLAFTDGSGKQWRVQKTFGGSEGRSTLESTLDGRTYRTEVQGRQVDEKLRELLGWGIPAPGGTRGAGGIPESFLSQVLLAEQDSVRKVLFESTLEDDPDETGKLKLTQALGALAQDPLFKHVLDDAQGYVDAAFTPKGRRKTAAGSPFVAIGAKVTEHERELAELTEKLKETQAAEARIQQLIADRDRAAGRLVAETKTLESLVASMKLAAQQEALRAQIAAERAKLDEVAAMQRAKVEAEAALATQSGQLAASERRVVEAKAAADATETARQEAAKRVAALTDAQDPSERRRIELEQAQKTASDALHEATRAAERASEALARAERHARSVNEARVALATAQQAERAAAEGVAAANGPAKAAKAALEVAQQSLRDAARWRTRCGGARAARQRADESQDGPAGGPRARAGRRSRGGGAS